MSIAEPSTTPSRPPTSAGREAPVVRTLGLGKDFGATTALHALDCSLAPGQIVGLLGPNGAGKTTTIKLLLGLLEPTRGRAEVLGLDCTHESLAVKRALGYVPDEPAFYDFLTGRETILFVARMRGRDAAEVWNYLMPLVETLDFSRQLDELVSGYSHGMKKKLALLIALAHRPRVLLMDEPTNGLDPAMAASVRDVFIRLASSGTTILLSTHLLDMADRLCHELLLLNRGHLVASGTPDSVRVQAGVDERASLEEAFMRLIGAR